MKISVLSVSAMATIMLSSISHSAVIVAGGNGDFESTTITNLTSYGGGLFDGSNSSVDGWTFSGGTSGEFRWIFGVGAEIYGPIDGDYALNLTQANFTYANVASTTITGLTSGLVYTLLFDTAVRVGGFGTVTVDVDGTQIGSFDENVGTSFVTQSFNFTATSSTATLAFNYGATQDNNGFMLDNVTVVPEPSAALLGGLGVLGLLRRRRR